MTSNRQPGLPSADDEMVPTEAQRAREACAVAVEEASRHRGWARRWKALAKRLVRWRWLTERDSEEVWSDCRAAYAQIAELERDLGEYVARYHDDTRALNAEMASLEADMAAERARYAELLERWKDEQRRRISAEDAQKSRGLLVELILAGEPAATAAFRAAAETLEARLALRTLGANLAMAGFCAEIQGRFCARIGSDFIRRGVLPAPADEP